MTLTHFHSFFSPLSLCLTLSVSSVRCLVDVQTMINSLLCVDPLIDFVLIASSVPFSYFSVYASLSILCLFCAVTLLCLLCLGTVVLPVLSCLFSPLSPLFPLCLETVASLGEVLGPGSRMNTWGYLPGLSSNPVIGVWRIWCSEIWSYKLRRAFLLQLWVQTQEE